jgi:hypothetical protein
LGLENSRRRNDLEQASMPFMVTTNEIGKGSAGGLKIHPEDSIKMSIKLYSF